MEVNYFSTVSVALELVSLLAKTKYFRLTPFLLRIFSIEIAFHRGQMIVVTSQYGMIGAQMTFSPLHFLTDRL